ncbi:MAG: extracellular solute-binding protein [Lachnospiraceae bacterium]|nr:extracellular solute-binding protein [Lachnospiraceae bacterium]
MKMKKFASVLLAGAMVATMAGCTSDDTTTTTTTDTNTNTTTTTTDTNTTTTDGEKTNLTMWCIATESDSNRHSYEAAIADVTAAHPEINFTWEAFENESYKTKIKAAVAADEMPDIFFTWSCAFLGDFVDAGRVYCLDDAYAKVKDELPESMMGNSTYNGKHYGVPLTMNIVGLFANMDLLKSVGYDDIPGTYEDFIACCDALKAADIIPFGCAGKETWCVTEYLESVIEKSVGYEALNDIFLARASWANDDVAAAVDTFQSLVVNGYFDPNGDGLSNDEIKANFMAGKYAFYMNGTWNCADFAANEEFFPKVKVGEFPVINADKATLGQLIGGPSDTLAVAASSPNAAVAADFTFELGRLICKYGYLDGCGLPAWAVNYDDSEVNGLTKTVAAITAKANGYVLFGDTAMAADDADAYLKEVAMVYGCEVDGKTFVEDLAAAIR